MFARVSTYEDSPDRIDDAIRNWEQVIAGVEQQLQEAGTPSQGAMLLVDRKRGKSMTITLWESEEDMRASAEVANKARSQAMEPTGGRIVSVEEFEVTIDSR
jgi:hypothetical protein